jgi:hypothetical protein
MAKKKTGRAAVNITVEVGVGCRIEVMGEECPFQRHLHGRPGVIEFHCCRLVAEGGGRPDDGDNWAKCNLGYGPSNRAAECPLKTGSVIVTAGGG